MADRPTPELQHHVVAEQIDQLVHLAGVNAARGHGHHLAHPAPLLAVEQAPRQVDFVDRLTTDVVVALHRQRIALQLAHGGARMQMIDAGQPEPFGDHAERHAVRLLPGVGAVARAVHVQDHVVVAAPVG